MEREDIALSEGAKLVLLCENGDFFVRVLRPGARGRMTFVTPKVPILIGWLELLAGKRPITYEVGPVRLIAHVETFAVSVEGDRALWGPRQRFRRAFQTVLNRNSFPKR